jgi:hypothetical protein
MRVCIVDGSGRIRKLWKGGLSADAVAEIQHSLSDPIVSGQDKHSNVVLAGKEIHQIQEKGLNK